MAGDSEWKAAVTVAVLGWLFSPVITFFLPKILACLGFDASQKLRELEIHTIPELKTTLQAVDQQRMMQRGKRVKTDLDALDKMAAMLRHALEDAEDIFDDAQHKSALRFWHHLRHAFSACVALCKSSCIWIARIVRTKSARLLQWARDISLSLFLRRTPEEPVPVNISAAVSDEPVQVTIDIPASDGEPYPMTTSAVAYETVPVTTDAAASGEPDPVTTSAAVSDDEIIPVSTGAAASVEPDPVTASAAVSDDEIVPVTTGAAASGEPDPVTASAVVSDDEIVPVTTSVVAYGTVPMNPMTTSAVAYGTVPMTTGVAASDEPDPMTTSAVAYGTVPMTTGVAASDEPDLVITSPTTCDDETVPVTTGAAASDEPGPVTASAAVSDNETVPVTASAAVSNDEIVPVTTGAAASDEPDPVTTTTSAVASGDETVPVTAGAAASDEPDPVTIGAEASGNEIIPVTTPSDSSGRWLSCLCSSFDFFKDCCTSLYSWLAHVFEAACFYRDWSYEVVGIKKCQENASLFDMLDIFLTAISRGKLKKRIHKVENTVSEVKKSPLLCVASNTAPNDIANKNRSRIRTASKRKVFGREALRDNIMAKLRETSPSSGTSPCYSAIGIYGVAGSGKTTFARYIRDYIEEECKEEKLFDTIICIHVSETFSVDDIFHEMLKDITNDRHPNISHREELKDKLKESLSGKRFFLILDDLWVKTRNDQQLEELISPLNVGMKGSKILVTARTIVAARALCDDETIKMPDLDKDLYFSMFMHYALGTTSAADEEFIRVGRVIAEKLHQSPIAAVVVAGRLGTNPDIKFWKNTANHGMLNDTMDALWWSYQPLNPDIRRCFEFCNIFPRRSKLRKDVLVHLWIAQGFVKSNCATEDMEDVAEGYIQELMSCSFLQPEVDYFSKEYFTIHDLLHDLLAKVAGSDCFRIENTRSHRGEGWKEEVPRDVRHLFVQNYDGELITKKILGLENLRTLIIDVVEEDTPVEEKVIESICKRLRRLRVLAVAFSKEHIGIMKPNEFLVPKSIALLKHLRYLAFRTRIVCSVTLPSALTKLHHIQLLDFYGGKMLEFPFADLVNLRHLFCWPILKFPNLGRQISLRTLPCFTVSNEQGYEVKQLRDLKKLCGRLEIDGLENVKSKEEALEANLAAKERITELRLEWGCDTRCSSEVEAEVLEGMCPPVGLQELVIHGYRGSRYPDWMVGKQSGGPEGLRNLHFVACSQLGPGPQFEAFPHLCVLQIWFCSWDSITGNMERLTLLKKLYIIACKNIRSLPTLPQSIEEFYLVYCNDEFMKSCKTVGHPNWQKIKHIRTKQVG